MFSRNVSFPAFASFTFPLYLIAARSMWTWSWWSNPKMYLDGEPISDPLLPQGRRGQDGKTIIQSNSNESYNKGWRWVEMMVIVYKWNALIEGGSITPRSVRRFSRINRIKICTRPDPSLRRVLLIVHARICLDRQGSRQRCSAALRVAGDRLVS